MGTLASNPKTGKKAFLPLVDTWIGLARLVVLHLLPRLYASLCHGEWVSPADLLTLSPLRSSLLHLPPHSLALPPRRGAEAPSFSVPTVTAKRRQGSRHHSSSHSEQQLPVVSETDFFPPARHKLRQIKTSVCSAKEPLTVCCKPGLDYQINVHHQPASKKMLHHVSQSLRTPAPLNPIIPVILFLYPHLSLSPFLLPGRLGPCPHLFLRPNLSLHPYLFLR